MEERQRVGVAIKAIDDDTITIGGYGVVFGGVDLTGEQFASDTDFWLDKLPGNRPVLYDHGGDSTVKAAVLGATIKMEADAVGLWVEAQLKRSAQYAEYVLELLKAGALGYSSGALSHLVERVQGPGATVIKSWPIGEFSLTPTPAEPRTLGVAEIRALAEFAENLRAWLPEDAGDASAARADEPEAAPVAEVKFESIQVEDNSMSEEQREPTLDYDKLATAIVAAQKAAAVTNNAGFMVVDDEADRAAKGNPFKSFGEFLQAVRGFNQGSVDKRLLSMRSNDPLDEAGFNVAKAMGEAFVGSIPAASKAFKAAPSGLGESLPQTGGYLVGSDRDTSILSRVYDSSQLLSRIAMDPVGPNSNGMTYYVEAETSRATGSRRGGVRFYWVAENSAVTTSAPTFAEMELKLKKAAAAVYVTEEQLQDTAALESYIMRIMPEELRFGVEDSILNGDGVGKPLGILNAACLVTVAKEVGQAAATITAQNIVKMWSRMWARSVTNAVWLVNQDVFPQLFNLSVPIGTGGALVFMPPAGISGAPYGTLFGRPVIVHESSATLGTVGDIVLADLREYQGIEKGGIQSASSIHVRFLEGESVYRFIYRVDGQPTWRSALTPFKGAGNTVSPFIALATRA